MKKLSYSALLFLFSWASVFGVSQINIGQINQNAAWTSAVNSAVGAAGDVFNVTSYGALGDGRQVLDAAITGSSTTLTSATANFVAGDVGKYVVITGAGTSGLDFSTTIASRTNSTTVVLAAAAVTTVSAKECTIGTDDTVAIQAAINAAGALAAARVDFPTGIYMIAGALTNAGSGNSQLYLPNRSEFISATTLVLQGAIPAPAPYLQYNGARPPTGGTILFSTRGGGTSDAAVIGGPSLGAGHFSSLNIQIFNLTVRLMTDSGYSGIDLKNIGTSVVKYVTVDVPRNVYGITAAPVANTEQACLILPQNNNNARSVTESVYLLGGYTGLWSGEHAMVNDVFCQSCWQGVKFSFAYHLTTIGKIILGQCPYGMIWTASQTLYAPMVDIERGTNSGPAWMDPVTDIQDPSNYASGRYNWHAVQGGSGVTSTFTKVGGTGLTCTRIDTGALDP